MAATTSAVQRLLEYIRIPSVSGDGPKGAYKDCAVWLKGYLEEVGLKVQVFSPAENKPIVLVV